MAQGNALDGLEPELQREVLMHAKTPENLYSLIRASARLFQVFLLNKRRILSVVARRQFHPSVLPEALTFSKVSAFEQPLPRETAIQYIRMDPAEITRWQSTTSTVSESGALCKLARDVRFFIEDFARNTLPIAEGQSNSLDFEVVPEYWPENPVKYSQLSDAEVGRLQRAFCRFEIYRHLFARCHMNLDHNIKRCPWDPFFSATEQAELYLKQFPDYQITEIQCIRDYLYRRLRGICDQLEEDAVNTLPPELFLDLSDSEFRPGSGLGIHLFTDDGKYNQDAHIEHLLSLGLPYIRRIFEASGNLRNDLFIRVCPGFHKTIVNHHDHHFISAAFDYLGENPAYKTMVKGPASISVWENSDYEDSSRPHAWYWVYPIRPPIELNDTSIGGLKAWGFVFWDFERLDDIGILNRSVEEIGNIAFNEYTAMLQSSVQTRLLEDFTFQEGYEHFMRLVSEPGT